MTIEEKYISQHHKMQKCISFIASYAMLGKKNEDIEHVINTFEDEITIYEHQFAYLCREFLKEIGELE